MSVEVGIKRGNYGATYRFVVKNVNYAQYEANIYVQSSGGTMLVDGASCTVTATDNGKNTLVEYTPASGHFGISASLTDYHGEITFSGANLRESTQTFNWQVYDELR